jgi:peptidoglycan biosynthesis protein MviN/MurJ (putative lipid II flippase)
MGLGVVFWIFHILLSRGFYATQTTWLPSLWGTLTTLLFIPVYVKLSQVWGVHGLALSGTLGIAFYVATLSWMLGRHLKKNQTSISFKPLWKFGFQWSLVICVLGAISFGLSKLGIYHSTRLSALVDVTVALGVLTSIALLLLRKVFAKSTPGGALF